MFHEDQGILFYTKIETGEEELQTGSLSKNYAFPCAILPKDFPYNFTLLKQRKTLSTEAQRSFSPDTCKLYSATQSIPLNIWLT